ncbi:MAG: head GIN domain-containing protein [Flavihumibacter sp.]
MRYTVLFSALLMLSSCVFEMGKPVKGDGNVVTATRQPGPFSRVEQKGSFNLELATGDVNEVQIIAEDNIAEHIETSLEAGTLVIKTRNGFRLRPTRDVRILVTAPSYTSVESFGSGDISSKSTLTGTGSLDIRTKGSGNIRVTVKVPEISASTAGSGDIDLSGECNRVSLSAPAVVTLPPIISAPKRLMSISRAAATPASMPAESW